jgi:hypothetical protein
MVNRNESSVAVSLRELLQLEERRAEQEADAKRAREAAARQAAVDVAEHAEAAKEERRRPAESRSRAEAVADREREARLQAIQEAKLVGVRHEVPAAARMKELATSQQHEQRLVALRERAHRTGFERAAYAAFALLVATWLVGGWYSVRAAQRMSEERASYRMASADQRSAYERLRTEFDEARDAVASLQRRLADLSRDGASASAAASPTASSTRNSPSSTMSVTPPPPQRAVPAARVTCKRGDPLCSDLAP